MTAPRLPFPRRLARGLALAALCLQLAGCAVVMVAGAAASVVTTGAGLAVDAAVGAAKLTGKAVGAAVDVVVPDSEK
jgi:anti-sigma factor RsiW